MKCSLCPRNCKAERSAGGGSGFCRSGALAKVARCAAHMWEEPCISGSNGSGAVFFSGCTLDCVYCQNDEISHRGKGETVTAYRLSEEYKKLESEGAHNINLVSASHFLPQIIESLDIYKPKIPIVYNCGGYESVEAVKMLNGYIDIFLPDFKYSDETLAVKYSKAPNYPQVALKAISRMINQAGRCQFNENGILQRGVLIRHLILPNHTKNSIGVLRTVHENFGTDVMVSLMSQYFPTERAMQYKELSRKITKREYEKVLNVMLELGLDGFCQDLSSAKKEYVPLWDFKA